MRNLTMSPGTRSRAATVLKVPLRSTMTSLANRCSIKGLQGVQGAMLLEEIQPRIDQEHDEDDAEILPFLDDGRSYDRKLWIVEPVTPAAYPPA